MFCTIVTLNARSPAILWYTGYYPPASEESREVANFNPKKISHTPVYCVKIS
jgi:hypothetical protein